MSNKRTVLVCQGTGCVSGGSEHLFHMLKDGIERSEHAEDILVKRTGCHGFCQQGPLIVIEPEGIFYTKVKTENMPEIIMSLVPGGNLWRVFSIVTPLLISPLRITMKFRFTVNRNVQY